MNTNFIVATALILTACSDDSKDRTENTVRMPELQGSWAGGCEDVSILPLSASAEWTLESLNFTRTAYLSMDGACATQDVMVSYKGEYSVSNGNDDQKKLNAMPIDFSYKTVVITPLTQAGADRLNIGFCGHSDWAVNTEKDLSEKSTETLCPLIDLPQMQYDIVSTEGGILRFGQTGIGQNAPLLAEERPTALNGLNLNGK